MRVLTVSAHYPPNFVSGGTLQPQRLSRGLRDRGHDVSVFAGWLGDRPPLAEWEEPDETGMPVHWIVSGPWIGWADERNWLNPEVTERFRRHLAEVRPDVVHFHSLQSLGAGLVPAAKAAGARVVVTMHDFWWLCSRQFLVDTAYRPCSVVVDAGTCGCEVDQAWRRSRGDALRTLLRSADLVLAPSQSAAKVLAANGLGGDRLLVDENGLPEDVLEHLAAATARSGRFSAKTDGVRFLYAGGSNEMKGVAVLLDALTGLANRSGWTLTAYGIEEYLETSGRSLDGLPVTTRPSFPPAELPAILGAHDVLVLPSVMRETYSLITREALSAGLPVVCTDTFGPEEVVSHLVNGLVVPAADAIALSAALGRVVEEPDLLAELIEGTRTPLAVRPLSAQVAGLERLLAAPDRRVGAGPVRARQVRHVVFACGIEGAPLRYRARLPAEALALLGITSEVFHYRDPGLLAASATADVVVMYRVPATRQILDLLEAVRAGGTPVVFDVDDLIFDPGIADEIPALRLLPPDEADLWLRGVRRYRTTLEASDAYVGSTSMLVEHAAALTGLPAHRFDNGVGLVMGRLGDVAVRRPRTPGPVRLGYFSGTTTHDEDWFYVEPAVVACMEAHPEAELWLGGHLPDTPALLPFTDRVRRLPFVPWTELPAFLRDVDVNLAPLAPGSRFNEAKSAIKWLEAALCATVTVASPTGPFREAIEGHDAGVLAADPDAWERALDELVGSEGERHRLGERARRRALLEWSPWRQAHRYADILEAVREAGPRLDRVSQWAPEAPDEPWSPAGLEAYPDDMSVGGVLEVPAPVPPRSPAPMRSALTSAHHDGVTVTVRRAAGAARRRVLAARAAWRDPSAGA